MSIQFLGGRFIPFACIPVAFFCSVLLSTELRGQERTVVDFSSGPVSLNANRSERSWFLTAESIDVERETDRVIENDLIRSNWMPVTVPANALGDPDLRQKISGRTVWYRREFSLAAVPVENMALRLGEISDRDRVYLNGRLIGATGEWDALHPQAYDRQRVYGIPSGILRPGSNVLLVQVKGYFDTELGIYRGETEIGPARFILKSYYLEILSQMLTLMVYLAVGLYFLLFYIRRRQNRENLFFAVFVLALVVYSSLRTQLKYELGFDLYPLKRLQYAMVWSLMPAFYFFVRTYFRLPRLRWIRFFDAASGLLVSIPPGCIILSLFGDIRFSDFLHNNIVIFSWAGSVISILTILVYHLKQRNRDAILMSAGMFVMLVALVTDVLAGLAIINAPTLMTYAFTFFVLGIALILANRFVDLNNQTEALNAELSLFNSASRRFVPFEFLHILEKQSITEVHLGDQVEKEMTVLFSDIRSFTTLSEKMTPRENFDFINSYLRRMGPVIRSHNGFIDKYIGDAIMALFPGSSADALAAAIEMQRVVREWNEGRAHYKYEPVSVGVGLHRGHLMLGTIGEAERMEGTVISDAVNLASRIESLTKTYGSTILISNRIREELPSLEHCRFVDRVMVKGKSMPVDLYEVYESEPVESVSLKDQTRRALEQGLELYRAARFAEAELRFMEVLRILSGDPVAGLYINRCRQYKAGVPDGWNGVEALQAK